MIRKSILLTTLFVLGTAPLAPAYAAETTAQPSFDIDDYLEDWLSDFFGDQGLTLPPPAACDGETFPTHNRECLIALAKRGGHVLYTRHVRTDTDFADQDDPKFNIFDCNQQRKVSAEGYQQATVLRKAIQHFGIKVKQVISSQFCRAWQTAIPMYGRLNKQSPRLNFIQEVECAGESDLQACLDRKAQANLTPLLSRRIRRWPQGRRNRALVAHDDPFKSTTGYYPFPMGATYIIEPKGRGRGFEVKGCIAPDAWFGGTPAYECNLDASLGADDFNEGVPDGTPL